MVSYKRFKKRVIRAPKVPKGVEVRFSDIDYGPSTKILPAVKDFFNFNNAEQKTRPKPEQWNRFIVEAKAQGINREELEWFKEHGYLTEQQIAKVYNNKADK